MRWGTTERGDAFMVKEFKSLFQHVGQPIWHYITFYWSGTIDEFTIFSCASGHRRGHFIMFWGMLQKVPSWMPLW